MSFKELNSRLIRWRFKQEEFHYETKCKKGKSNRNEEALSHIEKHTKEIENKTTRITNLLQDTYQRPITLQTPRRNNKLQKEDHREKPEKQILSTKEQADDENTIHTSYETLIQTNKYHRKPNDNTYTFTIIWNDSSEHILSARRKIFDNNWPIFKIRTSICSKTDVEVVKAFHNTPSHRLPHIGKMDRGTELKNTVASEFFTNYIKLKRTS